MSLKKSALLLLAAGHLLTACVHAKAPVALRATVPPPTAPAPLPTLADLTEAGAATRGEFRSRPVKWTVTHLLEHGSAFTVESLRMEGRARFRFLLVGHGKVFELATLIIRDGRWYLRDRDHAGVYRPWEAPFSLPITYQYWLQSDLRVVELDTASELGEPVSREGDVVTLRAPLKPELQVQLDRALALARAARDPAHPDPTQSTHLEELERLREVGFETRVSARTGILLDYGTLGRRSRVTDFALLGPLPDSAFDVSDFHPGPELSDPTQLPVPEALAMIGHCGVWRPGDKPCDPSAELLDVKTQVRRRVPYQGGIGLPGCFLKSRTHVIVSGTVPDGVELVDVNLSTGENRPVVEAGPLAQGFTLFPALSPDGKTLAVLHRSSDETRPESQVYLIDLETHSAAPLGPPLEAGFLSWLPDGRGLVLLRRTAGAETAEPRGDVVRLGRDGRVTRLLGGGSPLVLDRTRLLSRNSETRSWQLSRLDGSSVHPLGGGFVEHGFPAVSPDGKRLLWLKVEQSASFSPELLDLTTLEQTKLPLGPGLWTQPVWR